MEGKLIMFKKVYMQTKLLLLFGVLLLLFSGCLVETAIPQENDTLNTDLENDTLNTDFPLAPEKLIFIHHSCGNNWLNTGNGNLGDTLGANNYYVRDIYYGWDAPENIDIGRPGLPVRQCRETELHSGIILWVRCIQQIIRMPLIQQ